MRILQLISSAGYYGAEAVVLNLSKALRRAGCDVHIAVFHNLHTPNTEIAQHAEQLGFPVQLINCKGKLDWNAVHAIRAYLREHSVDLIHSHGYKADIYGYLGSRDDSVPIISTCHLWPRGDVWLYIYSLIDRIFLRRFTRVVAVSEEIGRSLQRLGVSRSKITIIDNGIDTLPFASAEPSLRRNLQVGTAAMVGLVGRLTPQKGPDYFLQAASIVRHKLPDVRFVFVGEGAEKNTLQALARRLGVAESTTFAGRSTDMPGVYRSLDLLVLPSREEGMPMTLIEALAAGTPVVATSVGSVPKLIKHKQTGLLVEPGDIPGLGCAIVSMLTDQELRQHCRAAGRQLVHEQYSADAMAAKYLSLYAEISSSTVLEEPVKVAVT
jgi:glycosyltransferase involved in cell wall biosynthesis